MDITKNAKVSTLVTKVNIIETSKSDKKKKKYSDQNLIKIICYHRNTKSYYKNLYSHHLKN